LSILFIAAGVFIVGRTLFALTNSYIRTIREIAATTAASPDAKAKQLFSELAGALAMYLICVIYLPLGLLYISSIDTSFVLEGKLAAGRAMLLGLDAMTQGGITALINFLGISMPPVVFDQSNRLYKIYLGYILYLRYCSLALVGHQISAFVASKRGGVPIP